MTTKPKDMNIATWNCVQRAKVLMKAEGIGFEIAYNRCRQGNRTLAGSDFLVEVEKTMADRKVTRGTATKIVITEKPKLHSDWLASQK